MHIVSANSIPQSLSSVESKVFARGNPSDKRRFVTPKSFLDLQSKLASLFPSFSSVQYLDEEDDWITIASQDDLDFVLAKSEKSAKCLRLAVTFPPSSDAVPLVPPHHHHHHHHHSSKFHSRFVEHASCPPSTSFAPSTPFTKSWKFRNEGSLPWIPGSVELIFVSRLKGDLMGAPTSVLVNELVAVGAEVVISVDMVAPVNAGKYQSHWRLRSVKSEKKFGQRVLCEIQVVNSDSVVEMASAPPAPSSSSSSSSEGEKVSIPYTALLARLLEMGFEDGKRNVKLLRRFDGDIDKVIAKLIKRAEKKKRGGKKGKKE